MKMKNLRYTFIIAGLTAMSLNSCNVLKTDIVDDPNFPSVGSVQNNATKAQLDALAIGQIATARDGLATYLQVVGTLGKEIFNFNSTESRWMTELNGLRRLTTRLFTMEPPLRSDCRYVMPTLRLLLSTSLRRCLTSKKMATVGWQTRLKDWRCCINLMCSIPTVFV